jgi:hypothetical protein
VSQETSNRSFDELARAMASGSISRGRALRLMGAALVGGTLASLGIGEAGADALCKPEGKKCRKDKQCCSGNCEGRVCQDGGGGNCPTGGSCETGFPFGCQNRATCFCTPTAEGTTFCTESVPICDGEATVCTTSQDCPSGWVCARTCCGMQEAVCNPPCGTILPGAASAADNQGMSGY